MVRVMKWITSESGLLRVMTAKPVTGSVPAPWAEGGGLARRALHELLFEEKSGSLPPSTLALLAVKEALTGETAHKPLIWCDAFRLFYPPAVVSSGIRLNQVCIVRPARETALWAAAECLRCPGVGAVVATLPARMSQVDARRLQLAAEKGGGVGLMLRPWRRGAGQDVYAAATRWLIRPLPAGPGVQRWNVEFVHGHGWRLGESFILESRRATASEFTTATVPVYSSARLADHAAASPRARASG